MQFGMRGIAIKGEMKAAVARARSAAAAAMMHSDVYGLLLLCERQGISRSVILFHLCSCTDTSTKNSLES